VKSNRVCTEVVRAMDWYPTFATCAGVKVPQDRVIDGRDIVPLLTAQTETVPSPAAGLSLNADVPLRREWSPPGEWADIITRDEYNAAFFYHGSLGALAAVRWDKWKLRLHPELELYDLEADPGETTPIRNGDLIRKLCGMAILFQEEMRTGARPAGEVSHSR
jgi:arylsulfatase A